MGVIYWTIIGGAIGVVVGLIVYLIRNKNNKNNKK